MELHDIRTLTLLTEFEKNKQPTQRELAKKLDISVGLVNLYLKRLAEKSYFKIKTYPKNRVRYLLTSKGVLEKTRLTYEYINYSLGFYMQTRSKINSIMQKLEAQDVRTIAFLGANEIAEIAYLSLKETRIELVAVIDNDKAGEKFMGQTIIHIKLIGGVSFDYLLDNTIPTWNRKENVHSSLPVPLDKIISVWQV